MLAFRETLSAAPITAKELHAAACFLRQAVVLTEAVRDTFAGRDADMAARMTEALARFNRELERVEAMLERALS